MLLIDWEGKEHYYPIFSSYILYETIKKVKRKYQYIEVYKHEIPKEVALVPKFNAYISELLLTVAMRKSTIIIIGEVRIDAINNS